MEKLLISACLLGIPCRYDGKSVRGVDVSHLREKYELVPVCPEIYSVAFVAYGQHASNKIA
jgi:uncharacterized protein YbbK (DUF523 family)